MSSEPQHSQQTLDAFTTNTEEDQEEIDPTSPAHLRNNVNLKDILSDSTIQKTACPRCGNNEFETETPGERDDLPHVRIMCARGSCDYSYIDSN